MRPRGDHAASGARNPTPASTGWKRWLRPLPALLIVLDACGGGDGDPGGAADASEAPNCEERRAVVVEPSPPPPLVRIERDGRAYDVGLPRPRSALLHPRTAPPRRSAALPAGAAAPRAIGLRVLVVTPDEETPSYSAARAAFQRIGVPHEVLVARSDELSDELLYQPDGGCRFAGIVLADGTLAFDDGGEWVSAFSQAEWDRLAAYEVTCGVREAVWYGYPDAGYGLRETGTFDDQAHVDASLTAQGGERFPYLVPDVALPIDWVYGYRSAIDDTSNTAPLLQTSEGDVLAAEHTRADGTEVMVVTVDSAYWSIHSQLLEFGIIQWLGRGLFIGERRVYLSPHIDDIFLASALWTSEGGNPIYRTTAEDVANLLAWDAELGQRLPRGSKVVTQLAFNGLGAQPSEYPDLSLREALLAAKDRFYWVNHTFTHDDMDAMGDGTAEEEIARNCDLAADWSLARFSCTELVTPEHSGLDNPDALAGMVAAGVRTVVSNTSITEELNPDNPGTNPSHNVGRANPFDPRVYQVPRHPTNVFFSASVVSEEVGLFNELFADDFGRELTYEEILDDESLLGLVHLLTYDVDPIMFHQANLRAYDGTRTLYTDWVDRVIERYTALVNLPILGLDLGQVARVMQQREAFDHCGLTATLSADRTSLHLESTSACVVPLTGVDAPEAGEVTTYGGVPTTYVALSECDEREVPLTP